MDEVVVHHPVAVKVVVTQAFRDQLIAEAESSIDKVDANLQTLATVSPETEAGDTGDAHEIEFHRKRLDDERQRLYQMRQQLEWRIREAREIEEGAELPFQSVQGTSRLKPGDDYLAVISTEIVLKDWKVVEIRRPG